jgi:hypothetical protein
VIQVGLDHVELIEVGEERALSRVHDQPRQMARLARGRANLCHSTDPTNIEKDQTRRCRSLPTTYVAALKGAGAVDPIWEVGARSAMRLKLSLRKEGAVLYEGVHEVIDAETFGRAFASVWTQMQDRRLQKTTSIGALMEVLNEDLLEELNGAQIGLKEL